MAKSKEKKVFSPEQANATLPLVRAIVGDISILAEDLRQRHERLSRSPGRAALSPAHEEELDQARNALERDIDRLRELEDELAALGVELKDYFQGLVDFPSLLEGRPIYLCWKAGEEQVGHWHEIDAGFAGRRKLPFLDEPSHSGERNQNVGQVS